MNASWVRAGEAQGIHPDEVPSEVYCQDAHRRQYFVSGIARRGIGHTMTLFRSGYTLAFVCRQ